MQDFAAALRAGEAPARGGARAEPPPSRALLALLARLLEPEPAARPGASQKGDSHCHLTENDIHASKITV